MADKKGYYFYRCTVKGVKRNGFISFPAPSTYTAKDISGDQWYVDIRAAILSDIASRTAVIIKLYIDDVEDLQLARMG